MGVLTRLGQYALVLIVASTLNFALPHLAPGDPVEYLYQGAAGGLTAAELDEVRARYGLDQPVTSQYRNYWQDLVRGELGTSVQHNRPVSDVLLGRLPWTLLLVGTATVLSTAMALLLGAAAAWHRGGRRDVGLVAGVLTVDAMPGFWIGMLLVSVFAVELGWFPSYGAAAIGSTATGLTFAAEVVHRLVLPALTLVLANLGATFLLVRGAMTSVLGEPFMLMAVAKGASPARVRYRHGLRNALLPASTTVALNLAVMLSGAVVIETVFAYPGLGRLMYEATIARDYPVLRAAFLLVTVGVIVVNILADLLYPLLDPRVRRTRQVGS